MAYFAKFTERGQRALMAAQKEAALLGRAYVGTEHLLLGVLTDPGAAGAVLKNISLDAAREEIVSILGRGEDTSPVRAMVYTPRTKKVLEQSVREAREMNQNYVGTEHILLALMREREGVAAHVLIKMGLDLNKAREELLRARPDVLGDDLADRRALVPHGGKERAVVMGGAKEDAAEDDPQQAGQPPEEGGLDRSVDGARARDRREVVPEEHRRLGRDEVNAVAQGVRGRGARIVDPPLLFQPCAVEEVAQGEADAAAQEDED